MSSATSGLVSSGSGSHSPTYSSRLRDKVRRRLSACRVTVRTTGPRVTHLRVVDVGPPEPGLLQYVLGVGRRAEHLVGDREQEAAMDDERVLGHAVDATPRFCGRAASGISQASE